MNTQLRLLALALVLVAPVAALTTGCQSGGSSSSPGLAPSATPTSPGIAPMVTGTVLPLDVATLVFDSNRTGNFEIFAMNVDGSGARQLTSDASQDSFFPKIEPSARARIVFQRAPRGVHDSDFQQVSIWVMNADGTDLAEIRAAHADGWAMQGHPCWSPDGSTLVLLGGLTLDTLQAWLMDPTGQNLRQVTHAPLGVIDTSFSPDGETIVCVEASSKVSAHTSTFTLGDVATFSRTTGVLTRLTTGTWTNNDPSMSPDGTRIVWERRTRPDAFGVGGVGAWGILICDADGSNERALLDDGQINSVPTWSLDGRTIFFHRMEPATAVRFSIYKMNADGSGLTELTSGLSSSDEYPSN